MSRKVKATKKSSGFDASEYCTRGLTEKEVLDIKQAFDLFDANHNGTMSKKELKSAIDALGMDIQGNTFNALLAEIDKDDSGEIDFKEFLEMMTSQLSDDVSRKDCDYVYYLFCGEKDGFDYDDLKKVATDLNIRVSDEEIQNMIKRADLDADNKISPDEFYAIMSRATATK